MKVFMSVLCNSRSIRYSYYFYQYSPEAIKAALLVIYGLKCYLSLYRQREGEQELLYFASYPNEHRVLSHVRDNLRMIPHGEIRISLRNCISLVALREVGAFLPTVPRLYRFARRLTRKHPFMPACRIFSTVTYFMRFRRLLDADVKAVFIACQYSPECLGLATAAHQSRVKVLFTNHASATGETGYVAPLHADLVAVSSQAVADLYQRHTPHKLNIVPFTIAEPQQPMRALNNESAAHRVGIYLTALTDEARLQEVIADLLQFPAIGSVFVRTHPAAVVNADLSHIRVGATDAQEAVERWQSRFCAVENQSSTITGLTGLFMTTTDMLARAWCYRTLTRWTPMPLSRFGDTTVAATGGTRCAISMPVIKVTSLQF